MSKLIILITFVLSFAGLNNASGAVYKWSDTDGNIRFSDIPPDSKEAKNIQEINISSANKMDSHTKKNLVEKVENKDIETELEQKTQDYKKVKNRRDDEDVSEFLKKLKEDKALGNNTTDKTTSTSFGTATPDANTNPSDTTSSPHSKLESNLESTSKLTAAKQNKLIKQAKNCAIAKANLKKLSQSNIILSKNNKLQKISEEQFGLKIKETKANIAFYC